MTVDNSNESDQVILATAGYDHTIKLWQTHSGVCLRTMQHAESQVNALAIQPNEPRLAAASYQHIRTYDLHSTNPNAVTDIDIVPKNITSIGYQEDGKWMYSGGEDSQVRIWDMRSSNYQCLKSFEGLAPITCVTLHPNQGELFIGDQSGNIYRWDMKTDNNEQLVPEGNSMILDIAIDPDGTHMAMVNSKGRCYVWSLVQGKNDEPTKMHPKHKFDAHKRQALKCKFSPDSTLFITTSADQTAKIWKTCDYSLLQELKKENQRWVWDAAFSSDSQYVFTASSDQNAKLWNVKTGAMEREYCGHQKAVTALAFRDISTD